MDGILHIQIAVTEKFLYVFYILILFCLAELFIF